MDKISINELLVKLVPDDRKKAEKYISELNVAQITFIEWYLTEDKEFFNNGGRCYAEAYGYDFEESSFVRNQCYACASRLLRNAKISRLITLLFTGGLLTENVALKNLAMLMFQHHDLKTKLAATKIYLGRS